MNLVCGGLHGLPLSLLLRISDQGDSEHARQETAQSFMLFAASLEQASLGHGSIVAVVVEILAIMATAIVVSILIISLFMPLIKLLNDLSVCVWTSGAWL